MCKISYFSSLMLTPVLRWVCNRSLRSTRPPTLSEYRPRGGGSALGREGNRGFGVALATHHVAHEQRAYTALCSTESFDECCERVACRPMYAAS